MAIQLNVTESNIANDSSRTIVVSSTENPLISTSENTISEMKEVDAANGVITYDVSNITPLSTEDLAKLAAEERIKMSQPQESEALDSLINGLCTMKRSFSLNELLLSFLEKKNTE